MGRKQSRRSSRHEDAGLDDGELWDEDAECGSFGEKDSRQHRLKRSGKRFHRKKTHKDQMEEE